MKKKTTVQIECGDLAILISSNSSKTIAKERQAFLDFTRNYGCNRNVEEKKAHPLATTGTRVTKAAPKNMSWAEISESIKSGDVWSVGDTVDEVLNNGEEVTFVVTQVTDKFVRFESRDCVGNCGTKWNESGDTKGGIYNSDAMKFLTEKIWSYLPEDLRHVIDAAERKYIDTDGETKTYYPLVFLPTASEVFEEDECYGDHELYEQLEYYKDRRNRMRGETKGEDTCYWWLASAHSGYSTHACDVSGNGRANANNAPGTLRVPVCFHIAKR